MDTPLMQQWRDAKSRHPDALVFFRVGDFYELFNDDAVEGARLLGLTLTSRNNGGAAEVPLAGVPVRARDEYLERLVRMGRRVAICEQVEDPAEAKGIVRREVVETVTPGVLLADTLLSARRNNWVVAVLEQGDVAAVAAADVSTGEVVGVATSRDDLELALARFEPSELLIPAGLEQRVSFDGATVTHRPDWLFDAGAAHDELRRRYRVASLEGFGLHDGDALLVRALGALTAYIAEVQPSAARQLRAPRVERAGDAMALDEMTRRNLELVEPLRPDLAGRGGRAGTLIDVLDETQTAMGARLLRRWLLAPLVVAERIWARQEAVEALVEDATTRRALQRELDGVRDIERLATRAAAGRIMPRELQALAQSLARVAPVRDALAQLCERRAAGALGTLAEQLHELPELRERLERGLADEPPAVLGEGGVIRAGFDAELDALRQTRDGAVDFIASLQARERTRTGVSSLKVGYNRVFGYYLEVTRTNLERVPDDYERRQTLANAERFVTPELKEWEARVLGAEEKIAALEARLFGELRRAVAEEVAALHALAERIAALDVLLAFARVAERRGYVRPRVHTGFDLEIRAGRHPVVETMMQREDFIPNDVVLPEDARVMILTGPNMAGKSTLLRQVGLIQLLAQVGSFVPAASANLPVCDRIFTRVGASDNLVRGQSTFMVEMNETAAILNCATSHSLVLLDEIGRGTATYDGVSIAWAVSEHLHEVTGCKTIFATHYHELTQLADELEAVRNYNVAVRETGDHIVFLRRLEAGGADRSYGIQVGRLAGLPDEVVARAREILRELEGTHSAGGRGLGQAAAGAVDQLSLFHAPPHPVVERLKAVDVERLTPLDALNLLAELRARLDRDE